MDEFTHQGDGQANVVTKCAQSFAEGHDTSHPWTTQSESEKQ